MKNPFSLIDNNDNSSYLSSNRLQNRNLQLNRTSIIKNSSLPFKPYEIKYEPKKKIEEKVVKQAKIITSSNASTSEKKQEQEKKIIQNVNDKKQISSQSEQIYEQSEQSLQKQYFLSKKNRIVQQKLDQHGDPPLLQDIGLETQMIKDKIKLVLKLGQPDYDMIMNPDLSGPILIAFTFGCLLLFSGQLKFADIYAIFIFGNGCLYFLFNFMKKDGLISLYNIMSILGYCLLPMLLLGVLKIFMKLNSSSGLFLSLAIALWSSAAAGNFIFALIKERKQKKKLDRKILVVYPLLLFYLSFAMIVIF